MPDVNPTLYKQSKDYLNNKINLMFRRDNLPPEAKDDYFRQANEFQLKTGSLKNFHYENDNFKIENQTPSPNNKDDEEKLSYAMKLDKEGNIQATDNKGNKLKPCSPEEMIKKIVQNFKSQMPKALSSNTIQIRIKKPDERITSIFRQRMHYERYRTERRPPKIKRFLGIPAKRFFTSRTQP